jgi:hypothetical protein
MATIKFFDGMDEGSVGDTNTQPSQPSTSGYQGVDIVPEDNPPSQHSKTHPSYDAKYGEAQPLPKSQFESPTDK